MRMGVGKSEEQYLVTQENIDYILKNNEKYQTNWLKGMISCSNYIKNDLGSINKMVEIGAFQGESTTLFAHYIKPNKLYAVDPHINGYDNKDESSFANFENVTHNFLTRIQSFPCVEYIRDFSYNVYNKFEDDSLDFVYIDGDHSYEGVKKDILYYLPKIKNGGYIGGHDLGRGDVTKAIIELFGDPDVSFEDSSWLIKVSNRVKTNIKLHNLPNLKLGVGQNKKFTVDDEDIRYLIGNYDPTMMAIIRFFSWFKDKDINNIVEINCFQGEMTTILAKYFEPDSLTVVDDFTKTLPDYPHKINITHVKENFSTRTKPFPCVKVFNGNIDEFVNTIEDNSVDMFYINEYSDKEVLKNIINKAVVKLKKPGYICGIGWGGGNVVHACLETIGEPNIYFKDSTWIKEII